MAFSFSAGERLESAFSFHHFTRAEHGQKLALPFRGAASASTVSISLPLTVRRFRSRAATPSFWRHQVRRNLRVLMPASARTRWLLSRGPGQTSAPHRPRLRGRIGRQRCSLSRSAGRASLGQGSLLPGAEREGRARLLLFCCLLNDEQSREDSVL
jgi:hypothetical protein